MVRASSARLRRDVDRVELRLEGEERASASLLEDEPRRRDFAVDDPVRPAPIERRVQLLEDRRQAVGGDRVDHLLRGEQILERRAAHARPHCGERVARDLPSLEHRHDVRMPHGRLAPRVGLELHHQACRLSPWRTDDVDRDLAVDRPMAGEVRDRVARAANLRDDLVARFELGEVRDERLRFRRRRGRLPRREKAPPIESGALRLVGQVSTARPLSRSART